VFGLGPATRIYLAAGVTDIRNYAPSIDICGVIDPQLLAPVQHRGAQAQAHLMVIRARAGLVRARTSLINTARGLTKSYGERLRG
jgi:transposase